MFFIIFYSDANQNKKSTAKNYTANLHHNFFPAESGLPTLRFMARSVSCRTLVAKEDASFVPALILNWKSRSGTGTMITAGVVF